MSVYNTSDLTKAEEESLLVLMEECGEVIQACSKILRHGPESRNPDDESHDCNIADLRKEMGDVAAAIDLVCKNVHGIDHSSIHSHAIDKLKRIRKYIHAAVIP